MSMENRIRFIVISLHHEFSRLSFYSSAHESTSLPTFISLQVVDYMMRKFKDLVGIEYDNNLYADGEAEEKYIKLDKSMLQFEHRVATLYKKIEAFEFDNDDEDDIMDIGEQVPEERLEMIQKMLQGIIQNEDEGQKEEKLVDNTKEPEGNTNETEQKREQKEESSPDDSEFTEAQSLVEFSLT